MNYISEDFHLHYIPSYSLYIQSDLHKDHLVVLDSGDNVVVYISYDSENPSSEASKILSFPFEKVHVILPQQSLIWVPSDVFDVQDLSLYTDYFLDPRIENIEYQQFENQNLTAIFQVESTLSNRWKNMFPNALILPSFVAVFNQAIRNMDFSEELLGVHIYGRKADIFFFMNGEMRIYNTYEIETADDLSYYILSIIKNFAIGGKIQKIFLSGASADSIWGERLKFYSEHLTEMKSLHNWKTKNSTVRKAIRGLNTLADITECV